MTNYLERACQYLGVEVGSVINPRIQGDDYVLIVDYGIAGGKKYYLPLSELDAIPDTPLPVPAAVDLGNHELSYRELQAIAKEEGIPANQTADELRAALWSYLDDEDWSEEEE